MDYNARRRKRILRPLVEMPAWKAVDLIKGMQHRQMAALLRAMESCTKTNCWYGEYGFSQALLPFVRGLTPNAKVHGPAAVCQVPLEQRVSDDDR